MMQRHRKPADFDGGSTSDPYVSTGAKWRALLGLPREATCGVFGFCFFRILGEFTSAFSDLVANQSISGLKQHSPASEFDLLLLDAGTIGSLQELAPILGKASLHLAKNGTICVAYRLNTRARFFAVPSDASAHEAFKLALDAAGLSLMLEGVAPDGHAVPFEYWRLGVRTVEVTPDRSRTARLARLLGNFELAHPERIAIVGHRLGGAATQGILPTEVQAAVDKSIGTSNRIESIRFRRRGAVVLTFRGPRGSVVVRIAEDPEVIARISRNQQVLTILRDRHDLNDDIRALIPSPIATCTSGTTTAFIEQALDGIPLWRLAAGSAQRDEAVRSAETFIRTLNTATCREVDLTSDKFDALVGQMVSRLVGAFRGDAYTTQALRTLEETLRQALLGKRVRLVLAHGDFAMGNLLCDQSTGMLSGVIDWDTWREVELDGVERWNLRLQLALAEVSGDLTKGYQKLRILPFEDRLRIALALLREPGRSLYFPSEFVASKGRARELLQLATSLLTQGEKDCGS